MLDSLKKYASSWVAQLLIGLLVLSFAVWGVSDIFTGYGANSIASVGSRDVTIVDFQRQYDQALRTVSQQFGQQITDEQARQLGLPAQVVGRLVASATLSNAADELGLGLSNDVLAQEIVTDPEFQTSNGTFDRALFQQMVRNLGYTEDDFVEDRRDVYVRRQIADALIGGLKAPDSYMRAVHAYQADTRKLGYVVLGPDNAGQIGTPTDEELNTYFDEHKQDWQAPEYRAIGYFVLSPEAIAQSGEVSDEEAKQRYDQQIAAYTTPEQRRVEQIVFPSKEEAEAAAASLASGKTFADLVAERDLSEDDVNLGLVTREKIIDPAIADAAFSLAEGAVSGVIDGRFGPVILHVTKIQPDNVTPYEDVANDIKKQIAAERAVADITEMINAVEDARAGGATLSEAAAKYGLEYQTIAAVDGTGKDENGNTVDVPGGSRLLAAAFESDVGLENDPVETGSNSYVWYEVTGVTQPRDRTLDEVRDKVVAAWQAAEVDKRLSAKAENIAASLRNGETIDTVAAANNVAPQTADGITRTSQPTGGLSAAAIASAFAGPSGYTAIAVGAQPQTHVVLTVEDSTVPPYFSGAPELAQADQQATGQIANDLLSSYIAQLQVEYDIRFNQALLQQALGLSRAETN